MYNLEQKIIDAFNSDSREIYVKAVFNNDFTVDGEYIKSFTINNSIGGTEALTLGNAYSNRLELNMFVPEGFTGLSKSKIEIYAGIMINNEVSYVPLGVFFAEEVKSTDNFKSVKITAYDAMLKINELGNTYKCSNTSANITPVNIIKDIAKQAGVTVNIGNSVDTITDKNIQKAVGVHYGSDGSVQESSSDVGIKKLIPLPQGVSSVNIKFTGEKLYELRYTDFNVVYYTDNNVLSYETYDGMTFTDAFDVDENGVSEQWIEGMITPPSYEGTLYMGFNFNSSSFEELPDLEFKTEYTYSQINYVNNSAIPNPNSVDFSARTMLGYMSGLLGCNAVINRSGELTLKRFSVNALTSISADEQYMNGYEQTLETPLTIDYLTTGTEPNREGEGGVITVGQGSYGFNFENPYITNSAKALNILNMYKGLQIMPCKIKYRGNPCFDCGDIIKAEDRNGVYQNVLILSQSLSVSGGFSSTIDCTLKTDVKSDFISTPSTKKLAQRFTDFERAYQDVISKLVGVSGGYVKDVYDTQGNRRAIAICENDIAVKWDSTAEKVVVENSSDSGEAMWVWSYGGLRFTRNGGANYEVAMNMKGQIYANYLLSARGTIGNWQVDDSSTTQNGGLFADYIPEEDGKAYRVFLQPAFKSSDNAPENTWVISTQEADVLNGGVGRYSYTSRIFPDGRADFKGVVTMWNDLKLGARLIDDYGDTIINKANNQLVFGWNAWNNGYDTYYEGGYNLNLRYKNGGIINIQDGTNTVMTIGKQGWQFGGVDKDYVDRATIETPSALVLSANKGNNYLYLVGSKIHLRNDTYINGDLYVNLYCTSDGVAPIGVDKDGKICGTSSSERYKENITVELDDELNPHKLYDLPVVQYNYKDEFKNIELVSGTQIGITAENVEKYYPNALIRNKDGQAESWQDRIMIPAMLKLIQEQKKEIDSLNERLTAVENLMKNRAE